MDDNSVLLQLMNVSVELNRRPILSNIDWELRTRENWGVVGSNGAGKTTLLKLARGDIWPTPGRGTRLFHTNGTSRTSPIGFKSGTGLVSPELLDRYKRNNWNIKVSDVVGTGFHDTVFLCQRLDEDQRRRTAETLALMKIEDLADTRFLSLSFGQAKKVLLARAVVHQPQLLILDELSSGLDKEAREDVFSMIQTLAERGATLLCSGHSQEDLLPAITHVVELAEGRIRTAGRRAPTLRGGQAASHHAPKPGEALSGPLSKEPLVRVSNADVFLNGKKVLSDISWEIMSHEHWALLGANGSGKTTLLNLISGDLLPAWGGTVERLGKVRSRTLWEIRRKISVVSADIQTWHDTAQTGLEVLLSGFRGTIGLHEPVTPEQTAAATECLASHGLAELADRDVRNLSYGQLRILLILRAVIIKPGALLLDEPLAGLDAFHRNRTLDLIDRLAAESTTIVYVTHVADRMPRSISHVLELKDGHVSYCGPKLGRMTSGAGTAAAKEAGA